MTATATTEATVTTDIDFGEFARYLATVDPDPDLDALAGVYRQAALLAADAKQRRVALADRIAGADHRLSRAEPKAIDGILTERAGAAADLPGVDALVAALEWQHRQTHLAWLARVRALALAEADRCEQELADPVAALTGHRKALDRYEAAGASRANVMTTEQVTECRGQIGTIVATTTRPLTERRQQADLVAKVAQARAQTRYGPVDLDNPNTWEGATR